MEKKIKIKWGNARKGDLYEYRGLKGTIKAIKEGRHGFYCESGRSFWMPDYEVKIYSTFTHKDKEKIICKNNQEIEFIMRKK